MTPINPNQLAQDILLRVKKQEETSSLKSELAALSLSDFQNDVSTDDQKKAFWINIYNAYYQILRNENGLVKPAIYRDREIIIATKKFSLDDIEHGILRRFRYKYSLGFLANIFVKNVVKQLAVEKLDYRIHFALNCGAKSCPPIAFYTAERINEQLNLATQSFLEGETEVDDENKTVHTTALFKWFLADFGGLKGIRRIYQTQLNKDFTAYTIKFKDYSWEDDLANFVDD